MTLSVGVYYRDPDTGNLKWLEQGTGEDLAGVEITRRTLWGADIMRELGLTILPPLGTGFCVDVGDEQLDDLE